MKNIIFNLSVVVVIAVFWGCGHAKMMEHSGQNAHTVPANTPANAHMNHSDFESLVRRFESPDRNRWQKPDAVLDALGDLRGKRVVDVGAGTGYFTVRLAKAGAHVLACDVDARFLDYLRQRIDTIKDISGSVRIQKVPFDDPLLPPEWADIVLIVNTYHHLYDRSAYFEKVKKGLKKEGVLVVIDFKAEETPMWPPLTMRVNPGQIKSELAQSGFDTFRLNDTLLPYQYILRAK